MLLVSLSLLTFCNFNSNVLGRFDEFNIYINLVVSQFEILLLQLTSILDY